VHFSSTFPAGKRAIPCLDMPFSSFLCGEDMRKLMKSEKHP